MGGRQKTTLFMVEGSREKEEAGKEKSKGKKVAEKGKR